MEAHNSKLFYFYFILFLLSYFQFLRGKCLFSFAFAIQTTLSSQFGQYICLSRIFIAFNEKRILNVMFSRCLFIAMKSSTSNNKTQTAPIVYKQTKLAPKYKFPPETLKYWVGV